MQVGLLSFVRVEVLVVGLYHQVLVHRELPNNLVGGELVVIPEMHGNSEGLGV